MVEKVFIHVDEEIFAKRNFAVRDILGFDLASDILLTAYFQAFVVL